MQIKGNIVNKCVNGCCLPAASYHEVPTHGTNLWLIFSTKSPLKTYPSLERYILTMTKNSIANELWNIHLYMVIRTLQFEYMRRKSDQFKCFHSDFLDTPFAHKICTCTICATNRIIYSRCISQVLRKKMWF